MLHHSTTASSLSLYYADRIKGGLHVSALTFLMSIIGLAW